MNTFLSSVMSTWPLLLLSRVSKISFNSAISLSGMSREPILYVPPEDLPPAGLDYGGYKVYRLLPPLVPAPLRDLSPIPPPKIFSVEVLIFFECCYALSPSPIFSTSWLD